MRSEVQEVLWLATRTSKCTKLLLPATIRLRSAHQRGNQSSTASNRGPGRGRISQHCGCEHSQQEQRGDFGSMQTRTRGLSQVHASWELHCSPASLEVQYGLE